MNTVINTAAIPEELRKFPNFLHWKPEIRDGKETKVPYRAGEQRKAKSNDSTTWTTFERAVETLNGDGRGLGWVVTAETRIVFTDIDECVDLVTGAIAPYAQKIIERCATYAERSPNDGVHIWSRGTLPDAGNKVGTLEMYTTGKYATMTGNQVSGTPNTLEQVDLDWLHRLMVAGVFDFKNDPKLEALMNGNINGYDSASEADLALCNRLAKKGLGFEDILAAVELSGLYDDKWKRPDYVKRTIEKGMAGKRPALNDAPGKSAGSGETTPYSEDDLAARFTATFGSDLRYTAKTACWYAWCEKIWEVDTAMLVSDLARNICRQASKELDSIKPGRGRSIASHRTVRAVVALASSDPRTAVEAEEWDADPWLLNVGNGVAALKTGELIPHDPRHLTTKIAGCDLAPSGTPHPLWDRFLNRVLPGKEIQDHLQKYFGYCLTGDTSAQIYAFAHGDGANGKGVCIRTITGILGSYAGNLPISTFLATNLPQHTCDLASMRGKRLITAAETEPGRRWNEELLKTLTGEDPVTARFMRENFSTFTMTAKLFIYGNPKPQFRSTDEATRRRLHLIPFTTTIPAEERDPQLIAKLKAEWPAILRWMVDGCLLWQRGGLRPPAGVADAVNDYMFDEDRIGRWLADCCVTTNDSDFKVDAGYFSSTAELFGSWKQWADDYGESPGGINSFSERLKSAGIKKKELTTMRGFRGVRLLSWQERQDRKRAGREAE